MATPSEWPDGPSRDAYLPTTNDSLVDRSHAVLRRATQYACYHSTKAVISMLTQLSLILKSPTASRTASYSYDHQRICHRIQVQVSTNSPHSLACLLFNSAPDTPNHPVTLRYRNEQWRTTHFTMSSCLPARCTKILQCCNGHRSGFETCDVWSWRANYSGCVDTSQFEAAHQSSDWQHRTSARL